MSNDEHSTSKPKNRSWLKRISNTILREPQNRAELIDVLKDAENRQLIDSEALSMIEGVLEVSEMQVRDIMIPRSQMVVVEQEAPPYQFLPSVIESSHSRFPVIGEDKDEIYGILLAKDLLRYTYQSDKGDDHNSFNIKEVLRPAIFVPESKRLDVLLKEFRENHNHMAIVVDEYGGVSGLVTIEDVLEQIVGDIEDEYDIEEEEFINKQSESNYTIKALTPIEDFNEYFHSSLNEEEFDTIGGLILQHFGHLPRKGETVVIEQFQFEISKADKRRISSLQVTVLEQPAVQLS